MHPLFKADITGAHNWVMVVPENEPNPFISISSKQSVVLINEDVMAINVGNIESVVSTDFDILMDDAMPLLA